MSGIVIAAKIRGIISAVPVSWDGYAASLGSARPNASEFYNLRVRDNMEFNEILARA